MSRWVSLNHARAKASANSSGFCRVAPRDRLVDRVEAQREVRRGHHRPVLLRRVVRVDHHVLFGHVLGQPLMRAGRALDQLPLVLEQHLQIAHVPLGRVRLPGALDAAADRVAALAAAEAALPAEALLLDGGGLGLRTDMRRIAGAVALPKVCPPATRATVSSSFMAMRAKVSRTSRPEATGSGLPFGPSGFT